jgi:hypothetical protein
LQPGDDEKALYLVCPWPSTGEHSPTEKGFLKPITHITWGLVGVAGSPLGSEVGAGEMPIRGEEKKLGSIPFKNIDQHMTLASRRMLRPQHFISPSESGDRYLRESFCIRIQPIFIRNIAYYCSGIVRLVIQYSSSFS